MAQGKSDLEHRVKDTLDELKEASSAMLSAWAEIKTVDLGLDKNQVVRNSMNNAALEINIVMNTLKKVLTNLNSETKPVDTLELSALVESTMSSSSKGVL
jgi:hypothetical protein